MVVEGMRPLRLGNGMDPATSVGPLATSAARDRIAGLVRSARDAGARVHQDLSTVPGIGWFYPPTAIADIDSDAPVTQAELFGPAVIITPYTDLDDVIDAINGQPGGLVTYLYGGDVARLTDRARQIACGSIGINTHEVVSPRFPFGGWRDSGLGHELGADAIRNFQRPRHIRTRLTVV